METSTLKQDLVNAMKTTKNKRMYERYQTILLYLDGKHPKEIADIIQKTTRTVYKYIAAFKNQGLEGLQMNFSPGRPCFLNDEQKQNVIKTVSEKTPEDVGFPAQMNWTCPLVKSWIEKEFSIIYSERGVLDLLHNLGFSCTRPTYTLKKADSEKQEEFKKNI